MMGHFLSRILVVLLALAVFFERTADIACAASEGKSESKRSKNEKEPAAGLVRSVFSQWLHLGQGEKKEIVPSFAPLVERLLPTVVNISTPETLMRGQMEMPQLPPGSLVDQLFNRSQRRNSLGSGVIIHPEGYVVTNHHLIADSDEITVVLSDDTELKAKIIGRDQRTDLALLKVDVSYPLPFVEWGDSTVARPGDWVIAIGNPYGLGGTVTVGIISAKGRDISRARVGSMTEYIDDFIQTDASINAGNSGGPLFDMQGRVIGINTAMLAPDGTNIGINFAIPSSFARPIIEQLKEYGRTKRGWIGVHVLRVSPEVADNIGLGHPKGVLVARVTPDGPAAKAGLKTWDVVLKFDGVIIPDPRKLTRIVGDTPANKQVSVVIWRGQKEETLELTVGQMEDPDDLERVFPGSKLIKQQTIEPLGIVVAPLTPDIKEQLDIKPEMEGVIVLDIKSYDLPIAKQIRPDDIIVEVDHKPIKTIENLRAVIDEAVKLKKKSILVQFFRDDQPVFGAIKLDNLSSEQSSAPAMENKSHLRASPSTRSEQKLPAEAKNQ